MPSLVRVLLLVENNAYPYDVRVRREAHALRDAGYQVAVIAPRGVAQRWVEQIDGIFVYRFPAPSGGKGILGYAFEFGYATLVMLLLTAWVAVRKGVDVIHVANPPDTLFFIGALFKLFGKRFVLIITILHQRFIFLDLQSHAKTLLIVFYDYWRNIRMQWLI